ncbi:hypothetical protein KSD_80330 [Ktedonobacter sp. SOSP1-85]|nr:hypothetical protein KSD_80330 [Ktedonobacter sp. SOSP1-85]
MPLFCFLNSLKQIWMVAEKDHGNTGSSGHRRSRDWMFFLLKRLNGSQGGLTLLLRFGLRIFSALFSVRDTMPNFV